MYTHEQKRRKHMQPSEHTHTEIYRDKWAHTHAHTGAVLPPCLKLYISTAGSVGTRLQCAPLSLSPGWEWVGARAVNSSESAVKSASIKAGGGGARQRGADSISHRQSLRPHGGPRESHVSQTGLGRRRSI